MRRRRAGRLAVGLALTILAAAPPARAADRDQPCGWRSSPPRAWDHVIWIWMENHTYRQVIDQRSAPFTTGLARRCASAKRYSAVGSPSLPNYIAATSGDIHGIHDDDAPDAHRISADNLFRQVRRSGRESRTYAESMPEPCTLRPAGRYAVRHNPAAYYTGIRTACATLDVPLASTPNASAKFTFVTPNLCNDMHDCSVATGDAWLSTFLPKILSSSTYTTGGTAIFITWDEDNGSSGNHVPTLVISPYTQTSATDGASLNHYSLLRTTEDMLGLGCLANACSASDFRAAFGL